MALRQTCLRQCRQLRLFAPSTRIRFSSTDARVTTTTMEASANTEAPSNPPAQGQSDDVSLARTAYFAGLEQFAKFKNMGTEMTGRYDPDADVKRPPMASRITLARLLAAQSHLGHSTSRWNPLNSRYIFGVRDGIHIISLEVTAAYLRRAARVVEEVARRGGLILFVGTRKGQKSCVVRAAEMAKGCHIFERWIPGSLTNGQQILGKCGLKVVNALDEELPEYNADMFDRPVLKPDLVVCFNPVENEVLLHECGLNNIPTIGVIDTDADPTRVTYPIPANDDSLRCIQLIAGVLGSAGQAGQQRRLEEARKGILSYEPISVEEIKNNPAAQD
ncbi:hypothetical protein VTN49DRAFT_1293 [Thermomyces lanuginosus]|uniref:mitochondrial 37S ribosomal protein uS2m n=1 Tax=Thermomyces lanuginosus TaxID=5541 RepID=UPI00374432C6